MSIAQLTTLSRVCFIGAVILVMIEIVFYFVLDINKAWHIVTGRQMKNKSVNEKKYRNGKNPSQRLSTTKLQILQKERERTTQLENKQSQAVQATTLKINNNAVSETMPLYTETMPLHIEANSAMSETMPLHIEANSETAETMPLHIDTNHAMAETMPLYINADKPVNDETAILGRRDTKSLQEVTTIGQTVELPKRGDNPLANQQSSEKPEMGVFRPKYDVTFTHTEVKI